MTHVDESEFPTGARIASAALGAIMGFDADRAKVYCDLILSSLSESNLAALQEMPSFKDKYRNYFASLYVAEGYMQGYMEGYVVTIAQELARRFGPLSAEAMTKVASSSIEELDLMGERLLTAVSLEAALAPTS
jgi:hypothetical protein